MGLVHEVNELPDGRSQATVTFSFAASRLPAMARTRVSMALVFPGSMTPRRAPSRAAFTSAVVEREPADSILSLGNNETNIYFYTDLRDLEGHSVVHRWEYNGRPMGEVRFDVKGPRWRVWSSKSLNPDWLGQWRVTVVDDTGAVLVQRDFNYTRALTSMNDIKPGGVQ